jgi:hypothetical protein
MIFVQDNFFTEKEFNSITNFVTHLPMNSVHTGLDKRYYGLRSEDIELINTSIRNAIIHRVYKKFFKPKKFKDIKMVYHTRSGVEDTVTPSIHQDRSYWNCLIFLNGPESFDHGTAFYKQDKDKNYHTQMVVSFKPNRAIMFRGRHFHGTAQVKGTGFRDTLNIFFGRNHD